MSVVRPATPDDLGRLLALEEAAFPGAAWSEGQLRELLARRDAVALLVEEQDRLRGAALGWAAGGVAELLRIAVSPDDRRGGHGRRLLSAFGAASLQAGAQELWLEVRHDNLPALALYRAAGMEITGRRPRYYADGTDALLLGCPLPGIGFSG